MLFIDKLKDKLDSWLDSLSCQLFFRIDWLKERKKDPKGWLFGAHASSELGVRPQGTAESGGS